MSVTFEQAVELVKKLDKSPDNDELLELYALFKQATVGDNNTPKPGMFDLKAKYKWQSWDSKKGLSSDEAKKQYVALYEKLAGKYGVKAN